MSDLNPKLAAVQQALAHAAIDVQAIGNRLHNLGLTDHGRSVRGHAEALAGCCRAVNGGYGTTDLNLFFPRCGSRADDREVD